MTYRLCSCGQPGEGVVLETRRFQKATGIIQVVQVTHEKNGRPCPPFETSLLSLDDPRSVSPWRKQ